MPSKRKSSSGRNSGPDAIVLLKQDHQKVRGLLRRLEATTERGTKMRRELLNEIQNEIKVHTTIEEEIFYPAYKEAVRLKADKELYYEAVEEHHVVDLVMPEIKSTDAGAEEFGAKAKVLKDLIEHHAEEEETMMFPRARRAMDSSRLRELGQQMRVRKEQLMNPITTRAVRAGWRAIEGSAATGWRAIEGGAALGKTAVQKVIGGRSGNKRNRKRAA
jgi:hemerythrin-like domain-containing protein